MAFGPPGISLLLALALLMPIFIFTTFAATAITRLALAGASVPEIATITGHSLKTVQEIVDHHHWRGAQRGHGGTQVVIDLANSFSFENKTVLQFFETSGRNLLGPKQQRASSTTLPSQSSGSIAPENSYFRAKVAQERLIKASGIPYHRRSTQFMDFLRGIVESSAVGNRVRISPGLFQPLRRKTLLPTSRM